MVVVDKTADTIIENNADYADFICHADNWSIATCSSSVILISERKYTFNKWLAENNNMS